MARDAPMRLRFAPSPTGHLHVGNARTALFNWLLARAHGGTFVLRIEDTDARALDRACPRRPSSRTCGGWASSGPKASRPAATSAPIGRPSGCTSTARTRWSCSSRGCAYQLLLFSAEQLEADRQAALAAGQPPQLRRTLPRPAPRRARRRIENGEAAVIRLRVPEAREVVFQDVVRGEVRVHTDVIGDPVLVRSDGVPAYNFAVVIDDALMGITHVIRGEDHISNTPRQMLLYEAFGWTPPTFAHVSLVMGPDHAPLSKRHGATSVAEFRARGVPARGADQLPGAARMVARRGAGAPAARTSWPRRFDVATRWARAPASSTSRSWRG